MLLSNCPSNCPFGNVNCIECHHSQAENGSWTGSSRCWNAQCLMLSPKDPFFSVHGIDPVQYYKERGYTYEEDTNRLVPIE